MATVKYRAMPLAMPEKDVKRFWSKVDHVGSAGCWPWHSTLGHTGYGNFKLNNAQIRAHRLAYFLHYGIDPDGFEVMHSCDNRKCCNPAHLSLGTHTENMEDMKRKGRTPHGLRCHRARLTPEIVMEIRLRFPLRKGSQREFAKEYGISHSHILQICSGELWARVPHPAK